DVHMGSLHDLYIVPGCLPVLIFCTAAPCCTFRTYSGTVRVGNTVNVRWGRHRHRSLQSDGTTVVTAPTTTVQDTSSQTNVRNPWADVTVTKGGNGWVMAARGGMVGSFNRQKRCRGGS
ncbi:hypothetical protein VaNZ11_008664, partial [Volvox africanus]